MNKDIIVVDDVDVEVESICNLLRKRGLNPLGFARPSDAIADLQARTEARFAYLIDMRIPCELDGSEELFNYVKDRKSVV
jgi:FixJ family two-component response regulator